MRHPLIFVLLVALLAGDPLVHATARRIREAMRLADLSLEKACLYMGLSKAHFSAQLAGVGHISASRLAQLPREFQQWYHALGVQDLGLPPRLAQAEPLFKMAKATGQPPADKERKRA